MTEHTTDATESADETMSTDVADAPVASTGTTGTTDGGGASTEPGTSEELDAVTSLATPTEGASAVDLGSAEESVGVPAAQPSVAPTDEASEQRTPAAEQSAAAMPGATSPDPDDAPPADLPVAGVPADLGASEESEPVTTVSGSTAPADAPAADLGAAEESEPLSLGGTAGSAPVPTAAASADDTAATPEASAAAPEESATAPEASAAAPEESAAAPVEDAATPSAEVTDAAPPIEATSPGPAPADAGPTVRAPGARPMPRPTPRPVPRPMPRSPQGAAPSAAPGVPAAPVAPPQDAAEALHAATFGRVDEEGTVYVREGESERAVGQFPGASAEEALALYVRRFLDLQAKVVLLETRLATTDMAPKEADQTLGKLTEELAEPAAVGDLAGLRGRLEALRGVAAERRAAAEAERAAAKEAAVAARTAIVEQAEKIAATDPERIQWRPAGEQLRVLLDRWKDAQRNGPRIDRPTEESLWKRFSHARTTFDRERRHFFAELESRNASARSAKEQLVAQAEKLSTSTDWGVTAGAYRDLMAQWKASGRASRKEDDALWARFRAAQDAFFSARDAASAETDAEFRANLEIKEALLVEAERLVPVTDLNAAKAALRSIQDRWDAAGKVPRGDLQRVEGRLRAVENAVRDADQSAWNRGNPETRARAEGAAAQLEAAIAGLEADLAKARAAGNARRIADAQAALDARRAWLEQVRRAAQGS